MAATEFSDAKKRLLNRMLRGEAARQSQETPLEEREPGARVPLAPSQQQVWLHAQMDPTIPLYNEPITLHYRGPLDRDVLERSFGEILRRHEIWRTTFASVDGQVVQAVHPQLTVPIPLNDLRALPEDQREQEALRIATAEAKKPFDLGVGPLLRARLLQFSDTDYRLHLTLHHIIFDGVSIYRVLLPELSAIYEAFSKGLPSPLPEPRYQYADYAIWQERLLNNDSAARQMDHWKAQLAGEIAPLQLPTDRARPAIPSYRGGMETFALSGEMTQAIKNIARAEGATPYIFLLAAFQVLLHRYTGQEDFLVGAMTDGRRRPEFEPLMGYFLNTAALRAQPRAHMPFREFLERTKETVLSTLANRDIPFDRLIRELQWKRNANRSPLQAMFSIEPPPPPPDAHWDLTQMDVSNGASKLDLYLEMDERPEGMIGRFLYSTELFDSSTIRRMVGHWITLLGGILRDPSKPLAEFDLLTEEERHRIGAEWNQTARSVPHTTIHQAFERQAAISPNAIAVQFEDTQLTYRELNQRANQLACRLQEEGAGPETLVALCVERSCEMLVSVLAVLKAGAAYLPVDPDLPRERIQFLMEDGQPRILLTQKSLLPVLPHAGMKVVDCHEKTGSGANVEPLASPENLAYVLYTSGSTGRPKGVEILHGAVINFLESMRREPGFTAADTVLAITTLSFDIAALEMFLPLVTGGRVVIASRDDARNPVRLRELFEHISPSVLQATPSTWRALVDAGWNGSPDLKILCGGEAMARDLAERLLTRCGELWNMYGPTETTIWSTVQRIASPDAISIGKPIDNTQIYVLDRGRRMTPAGVAGELYIGGAGLARGYLGRPELTGERFIEAPEIASGRIYRTGDMARWLPDGTLECLGRADHQVKIRGFRIELEEIEAALLSHPEIRAAAVRTWPDASGHLALAAYIVSSSQPDARAYLEKKLPYYMVPASVARLDELPLTPNGKVDRKRLPPPDLEGTRAAFVAPADGVERRLTAIWGAVLDRPNIGVRDNFFDLGGHSLLVAKLLRRVEAEFGERLSMAAIFHSPTVERLADVLRSGDLDRAKPRVAQIQSAGSRPALFWINAGPKFRALAARLGEERPFLGVALDSAGLDELPERPSLEQLSACLVRSILAVQPEGPYYLGGWCASGILAYEAACQLENSGHEVAQLFLLDSLNPLYVRGLRKLDVLGSQARFHRRKLSELPISAAPGYLLGHAKASIRRRIFPVDTMQEGADAKMYRAITQYQPKSYSGRVALLEPEERLDIAGLAESWADVDLPQADLYSIPGTHDSAIEEPYAAHLAARIAQCLHASASQPRARKAAGR